MPHVPIAPHRRGGPQDPQKDTPPHWGSFPNPLGSAFRVKFWSKKPKLSCEAWLGDTPPTPTGGGGGWETVQIPNDSPVLVWRGRPDLLQLSISIVCDRFIENGKADEDFTDLLHMWRPSDPEEEPPTVHFDCDRDSIPYKNSVHGWKVTGLDWGDAQANHQGQRTQQKFTVTLTEYRPDVRVKSQHFRGPGLVTPSKNRKRNKTKGSGGDRQHYYIYIVKARSGGAQDLPHGPPGLPITQRIVGESLADIARKQHVPGGWQTIAALNGLNDPNDTYIGQRLRLPR